MRTQLRMDLAEAIEDYAKISASFSIVNLIHDDSISHKRKLKYRKKQLEDSKSQILNLLISMDEWLIKGFSYHG